MALMTQVAPPARRARSGGIKDVTGEFTAEPRLGATEGITWEDAGCGLPRDTFWGCFDALQPEDVADRQKTFDDVSQIDGIVDPFALYAGVRCWLGGDTERSYEEQAKEILSQGEDRAVEDRLWAWASVAANPTYAADIVAAIGAAENHADKTYVGQPVLLMSRAAAIAAGAAGAISLENGKLQTVIGTPVVASGEFDSDSTVAAIGAPIVVAGEVTSRQVEKLKENKAAAIAERIYALGVDCEYRHVVQVGTAPDPDPEP